MSKKDARTLSSAELSSFCGQVALILEAGLPLYDGMETLAGTEKGGENGDLYQAVSRGVTETGSLYEALKADKRWPEYMTEMVQIGERTGNLEQVMRGLEKYYAREDRIRSSVVSAVTYPLVLGIMMVLIVLILLWRVLPVFRRVLDSLGGGLNESGNTLMRIGVAVGWIVMILVALAVIAVVVGAVLWRTGHKDKVEKVLKKVFPPYQRFHQKLSASRVGGILSMMLSSGFPTDEALEMTSRAVTDPDVSRQVQGISEGLSQGKGFSEAVADAQIFDELQNRMIKMGEATGSQDKVLSKLAELNEEQAEESISRMVSIIEPTLVALLSVIIGGVLLTVMMPMAGILSSL